LNRVLVVGGGVGGMSCAISLQRLGLEVDLVEIDPAWRIYGAGITITSATLRACQRLGILDAIKQQGATWSVGEVYAPDGALVAKVEWPAFAAGQPSAGGIMRPALHGILSSLTRATGVKVRLGVTVSDFNLRGEQVHVSFSDGTLGNYDLVIGADGVMSKTRERLMPDAPRPTFTGQSVYRIVCERPAGLKDSHFYPLGDKLLGCSLVSATHMYLFLLLPMPGNPWLAPEVQPQHLYEQLAGWGGFVAGIRERVRSSPLRETINYRPLEPLLLPSPWFRDRVLLIGDAAHATTPHMASGAGLAIEDGLVLADELRAGGTVAAVLTRFMARRFERCRSVVQNSIRLGEMEMGGESPLAHTQLIQDTMTILMREP
jgi:2-polyprenyl-6-methoxyphenol hydroxylase-like FAD-dependent oxidoreductase